MKDQIWIKKTFGAKIFKNLAPLENVVIRRIARIASWRLTCNFMLSVVSYSYTILLSIFSEMFFILFFRLHFPPDDDRKSL